MRPDPDRALGGSDASMWPDPDQALGGSDPDASMVTLLDDTTMMAQNPADWRASLLAYLLKDILPLERTEAR